MPENFHFFSKSVVGFILFIRPDFFIQGVQRNISGRTVGQGNGFIIIDISGSRIGQGNNTGSGISICFDHITEAVISFSFNSACTDFGHKGIFSGDITAGNISFGK